MQRRRDVPALRPRRGAAGHRLATCDPSSRGAACALRRVTASWLVSSLVVVAGCGADSAPREPPPSPAQPLGQPTGEVRPFSYPALDGSRITTASLKGRVTVIALVASYDDASIAQLKFLRSLARRQVPRINAVALVLEPPNNRPMIEAFAAALELGFPVALADQPTIEGRGPFPGLHHVPSVVILDPRGREVWRNVGLVQRRALAAAVEAVQPARPTLRQ